MKVRIKMNIQLNTNELKACLKIAAKKDVRYYLNGVLVNAVTPRKVVLVATDGNRLIAINADTNDTESSEIKQLIIPREAIDAAIKGNKDKYIFLKSLGDNQYALNNTMFTAVDAKYPDYERVIPGDPVNYVDQKLARFNPKYLLDADEAMKLIHGSNGFLMQRGTDAAIQFVDDSKAVIVIMPLRDKDEPRYTGFMHPVAPKLEAVA